ncbi:MAG: Do family serine endopeptidase [Muribaculaceae bacterium]|nr:Do family serine endopeptidase [Muribaculaceae bacterium]
MNTFIKTGIIALGVIAILASARPASESATAPADAPAWSDDPFEAWQQRFTRVAENTVNGVVSVKSFAAPRRSYGNSGYNDFFSDPFFEYFFGQPGRRQAPRQESEPQEQQLGLGSGVILSSDGYIVTNNHVIDGAERLEVTLNDNRNFAAKVIGADPVTDLALIKIESEGLHLIPMGDSDSLRVGEWVLAVGNPFGFTSSVTQGIVSAKARNISAMTQSGSSNSIESYIQTDAAVNRGNSGGALVNLRGELVGINAAIYSQTGTYAGCSFAIPTSIVNKVVKDLKEYGMVQRAMLGIRFAELTPELVKKEKVSGVNAGIYVLKIEDNSAAAESDLQAGDVIVALDNQPTHNTAQLQEALARYRPGDRVAISYVRDGRSAKTYVTLRNNKGNTEVTRQGSFDDLGCSFAVPSEETLKKLGIRAGVEVKDVRDGGKMKRAGIRSGFIITDINNAVVSSGKDVEKIYRSIVEQDEYDHVMFVTGIYPLSRKKAYFAIDLAD